MITKHLVKKLKLTDEDFANPVSSVELEYYLIESEVDYIPELADKKVYGVSVVKKLGETCLEEEIIKNYSSCIQSTKHILQKLHDNLVTPVSLQYVLEDMACM